MILKGINYNNDARHVTIPNSDFKEYNWHTNKYYLINRTFIMKINSLFQIFIEHIFKFYINIKYEIVSCASSNGLRVRELHLTTSSMVVHVK